VLQRMRERWRWSSAEGDEFHAVSNVAKMSSGHPLNDSDRWPWLSALAAWIGAREAAGDNCERAEHKHVPERVHPRPSRRNH
jgi:carbohydrate kinase (thermoresistant glucokinase family)